MSKKVEKKWKKAVWQYLIDHSIKTKVGHYKINFYIKDQHTFWNRVRAREKGYFKRKDLEDEKYAIKLKRDQVEQELERLRKIASHNDIWAQAGQLFHASNHPIDKIVILLLKPLTKYRKKRLLHFQKKFYEKRKQEKQASKLQRKKTL